MVLLFIHPRARARNFDSTHLWANRNSELPTTFQTRDSHHQIYLSSSSYLLTLPFIKWWWFLFFAYFLSLRFSITQALNIANLLFFSTKDDRSLNFREQNLKRKKKTFHFCFVFSEINWGELKKKCDHQIKSFMVPKYSIV